MAVTRQLFQCLQWVQLLVPELVSGKVPSERRRINHNRNVCSFGSIMGVAIETVLSTLAGIKTNYIICLITRQPFYKCIWLLLGVFGWTKTLLLLFCSTVCGIFFCIKSVVGDTDVFISARLLFLFLCGFSPPSLQLQFISGTSRMTFLISSNTLYYIFLRCTHR